MRKKPASFVHRAIGLSVGALAMGHVSPAQAALITDSNIGNFGFSINNYFLNMGTASLSGPQNFYNRYVIEDASFATSFIGLPVAPGSLIGPTLNTPTSSSNILDSTTATFTPHYQFVCTSTNKYGACTSGYDQYYGSSASYSVNDNYLGNLLLPVSFVTNNQTDFGWIALNVTDLGTQQPYNVSVAGLVYDNSGNAVMAGVGSVPADTPEPPTLPLLAAGLIGLAAYRLRQKTRSAKRS